MATTENPQSDTDTPSRAAWVQVDPSTPTTAELLTPCGDRTECTAPQLRRLAADAIRSAMAMELWALDAPDLDERLRSTEMALVHDVPA